jgi:hypothetical protein
MTVTKLMRHVVHSDSNFVSVVACHNRYVLYLYGANIAVRLVIFAGTTDIGAVREGPRRRGGYLQTPSQEINTRFELRSGEGRARVLV